MRGGDHVLLRLKVNDTIQQNEIRFRVSLFVHEIGNDKRVLKHCSVIPTSHSFNEINNKNWVVQKLIKVIIMQITHTNYIYEYTTQPREFLTIWKEKSRYIWKIPDEGDQSAREETWQAWTQFKKPFKMG